MKTGLIFFVSVLLIFECVSQKSAEVKPQGLWSFSRSESVMGSSNADAAFSSVYYRGDIFLEGDSIWILDYPCEKIGVRSYSEELFQMIDDSTLNYGSESYSKQTTYDLLAVERLKAHKFNSDCYQGKWMLNRSESGGDGTGVVFIYPFEVVDILIIENECLNDGIFRVPVNGVEYKFKVSIEHGFPDRLILTPADSRKKDDTLMWTRSWDLPPPDKKELKKIKRGEGVGLQFAYSRM